MTGRAGGTIASAAREGAARSHAVRAPWRRRRVRWPVFTVVLLVLLAGTAELVTRHLLEGRISDRLRARIGDNEVRLDGCALVGLARGRLDRVTVSGDRARLGRLTGASVDLRLTDVEVEGRTPHVGSLRGRITVPPDAVADALRRSAQGLAVSGVRADPAHGTLVIEVSAGLGSITVRPSLGDGRATFTLEDARILGRPAPPGVVDRVEEALRKRPAGYEPDPGPVKVTALEVTSAGLVGVVRADDVTFTGTAR